MQYAILFLALIVLGSFAVAGISAAPWVPTKPKQRKRILDLIDLKEGMTVYDLGCGDGSMLFAIAQRDSSIKAIGFEISLLPYLIAKIRKAVGGKKYRNVSIRYANLFSQNLTDADLIFVFLLEKCYPRLQQLLASTKDTCQIVVEAWALQNIEPYKHIKDPDLLSIYIYQGAQLHGLL